MSRSGVQIKGDKAIARILNQLPSRLNKSFWRKQARKASRPIIESARSKVPVDQGDLKRAIKYKDSKKYKGGFVAVDIKKDRGKQHMKGMVQAFGAKSTRQTRKGAGRGNINRPIRDFIREAGEDSAIECIAVMEKNALPALEREVNKLK